MIQQLQPIDKISLTLILILSLVIGIMVVGDKTCGNNCWFKTSAKVEKFTWENQEISATDTSFILSFNRPMERASVEENLIIEPPLPGKISWAGRKLAYTLETPAPYGETYQIKLEGAKENFANGNFIEPFVGKFNSRDRAFAYIGNQGEEQGKLILYNLTRQTKTILTPSNLVVMDFKFYPDGKSILFSAANNNKPTEIYQNLQLYKINTGVNSTIIQPPELILDNQDYQNNQFDISSDGKTIVVQRINRKNTNDFDLWIIKSDQPPQPLNTQGGDFLIAPDGQTLAVAQGEGIALLPLKTGAQPLDFLPKFGRVLNFSRDGTAAAMVNFNTDNAELRYTQSLFYVNNLGPQKELLNIKGSIIDCQFNPTSTHLYCLVTKLMETEEYLVEQPYFIEINLKTGTAIPLLALPNYQDIQISMAPDGLGILFDQVITSNTPDTDNPLTTNSGQNIVGGNLWLLIPVPTSQPQLEELPFVGFRPQWLP